MKPRYSISQKKDNQCELQSSEKDSQNKNHAKVTGDNNMVVLYIYSHNIQFIFDKVVKLTMLCIY